MNGRQYYIGKTFAGMEPLLLRELEGLGAQNCRILSRAVGFEGDMDLMYRANYFCRTALRILWLQKQFTFGNNRQFYEQVFDFPAEKFLDAGGTLAVHATVADSIFNTPLFASLLAKDAVCDRFRDLTGRRPSVDKENPDVRLQLHVFRDSAQLYVDSSGESLHKRGYKVRAHPATVNEAVAAAMVMLSGWHGECDFIDPMCGGGTLLIEAAMKALDIPAGFCRRHYGFHNWKCFDPSAWKRTRESADIRENVDIEFYGSDIDARSVDMARQNVREARLSDFIHLTTADMRQTAPARRPSTVMVNPPYGERLRVDDINRLYGEIGSTFKHRYAGCNCFLISPDMEAVGHIGLHHTRKVTLYNGPIECKFLKYEIFEDDRKTFAAKKHASL